MTNEQEKTLNLNYWTQCSDEVNEFALKQGEKIDNQNDTPVYSADNLIMVIKQLDMFIQKIP